jgi:hypothetical protein
MRLASRGDDWETWKPNMKMLWSQGESFKFGRKRRWMRKLQINRKWLDLPV